MPRGDELSLADSVFLAVKSYCGKVIDKAVSAVIARCEAIDKRLDGLVLQKGDPGLPGKDASPEALKAAAEAAVQAAVVALPRAKDGDPGPPGESVDYDRVATILKAMLANLPAAKDGNPGKPGKDAEVDYDQIGDIIALAVSKEFAKVTIPKNGEPGAPGRDADPIHPDTVRLMIVDEVGKAVSALPKAKDGESIDPEVMRSYVRDVVAASVAQIPRPENGKDADTETIKATVMTAMAEKFDALPKPENGKDAEVDYTKIWTGISDLIRQQIGELPKPTDGEDAKPEDIAAEVARQVALIPQAEPGKDVDPEFVRQEIAHAVALLPRAIDGVSVTLDDVMPFIDSAVKTRIDAIPPVDLGPIHERYLENLNQAIAQIPDVVQRCVDLLPKPKDGESIHPDTLRLMMAEEVRAAVNTIPKPADGNSVDPADVERMVEAGIVAQFESLLPYLKGDPGEPGMSPDDLQIEYRDEDGELAVRLVQGERTLERLVRLNLPREAGVHVKGKRYRKSSIVTYGGSAFVAQRDTDAPIGGSPPSPDWRLLVQRGRDAN